MISGLLRLVVLRVLGARALLVLAVLGWVRNRLWPRTADEDRAARARSRTRRTG